MPMNDIEMRSMLIEYMGKGFLDNIISILKQDDSLYKFIPDLLGDGNLRVRLGVTALVEELAVDRREELKAATPGLIELLESESPTIRGDAVYVLGIIKDKAAADALRQCLNDGHPGVRELAGDALKGMDR